MTTEIRAFLLIGSILTFFFVIRYIRKSRVRIEDTLFWIIFSIILILISAFPEIVFFLSKFVKIESPINFVYLLIIFILLVNQFYMSVKLSQLKIKMTELVQQIGIENKK